MQPLVFLLSLNRRHTIPNASHRASFHHQQHIANYSKETPTIANVDMCTGGEKEDSTCESTA